MPDARTIWVSVANVLLAGIVLACIAAVVVCIAQEFIGRFWKFHTVSKELNGDMKRWFGRDSKPASRRRP